MGHYVNSELYESFDKLGSNASYEEIKDWVIYKCDEYEKLVELISTNEFLNNSNESLFEENSNLSAEIMKLEEKIWQLKNYIKVLESKTNEQTTND